MAFTVYLRNPGGGFKVKLTSGVAGIVVTAGSGQLGLMGARGNAAGSANVAIVARAGVISSLGRGGVVLTPRASLAAAGVLAALGRRGTVLAPRLAISGAGTLQLRGRLPNVSASNGIGVAARTGHVVAVGRSGRVSVSDNMFITALPGQIGLNGLVGLVGICVRAIAHPGQVSVIGRVPRAGASRSVPVVPGWLTVRGARGAVHVLLRLPVPENRLIRVPFEARIMLIGFDNRFITVAAESRYLAVTAELRYQKLTAEPRMIAVLATSSVGG